MADLDPLLARDTIPVTSFALCKVLLMNDARYPWVILVPDRDGLSELHDLAPADQLLLNDEIMGASRAMAEMFTPEKVNVGALGNIVRQLHIHVVARRTDDPAWPGPVWGHSPAETYVPAERDRLCEALRRALAE